MLHLFNNLRKKFQEQLIYMEKMELQTSLQFFLLY